MRLDEIFWLDKQEGFTRIHRASADPQLVALAEEGEGDDAPAPPPSGVGFSW
jgi:hypothetical protein